MPDENKNPDVGQVTSPEGATENKELLEKIAKMKPDEMLDFYNNVQEMRKAATQKSMETAESIRRAEQERLYWENEAKRASEERQRAYGLLDQFQQQGRQTQPTMPDFTDVPPEKAFAELYKQQQETRRLLEDERKAAVEREQKLMSEINATRSATEYKEFLKTEVYPKYPRATDREINNWFSRNPNVPPNPQTVLAAAQEIQGEFTSAVKAEAQRLLEEKDALAKQAQGLGGGNNAPMAALPEGKSMLDLPEEQAIEQLKKDFKHMGWPGS